VPRLTSDGLKWVYSGDSKARQCLQYRGVLPVCGDSSVGSPDGAILAQAFQYVSGCRACACAKLLQDAARAVAPPPRRPPCGLLRPHPPTPLGAPPGGAHAPADALPPLPSPAPQASSADMIKAGDKVVVIQCPRETSYACFRWTPGGP
jgi:hypothetical protein